VSLLGNRAPGQSASWVAQHRWTGLRHRPRFDSSSPANRNIGFRPAAEYTRRRARTDAATSTRQVCSSRASNCWFDARRPSSGHVGVTRRIRGRRPRCSHRRRRRRRGGRGRSRRRRYRRGRRRRSRRRRQRPSGQEEKRVDVAVRFLRTPDAEMDVRSVVLRCAARADRGNPGAFDDRLALPHARRPKMRQRHRVAVASLDRQRPTADRHRARKGHDPRGRREHRGSRRSADVDTAVLAGRVGVAAETELLQDRPVDRPRPGCCGRRGYEHGSGHSDQGSAHLGLLVF
jgi:hypothetical protein